MIRNKRKPIIILIMLMLVISLIPPANHASAINIIEDGIPLSTSVKYKIPEFPGGYDYYFSERWDVVVDGVNKGQAALFAPKGEVSHLGRTMFHDDTVYSWGNAFNGNPNYVQAMMSAKKSKINRVSDQTAFYRNYSVEVGRHSGATVKVASSNGKGYLQVVTSPYPTISKLSAPLTVKQNEFFDVTFSGVEYDPFSTTLEYGITVDGYSRATGKLTGAQLGATPPQNGSVTNKTEQMQIFGTGSHTIELTLYDGIKRPTRKTIPITVVPAAPTGSPYLEIDPAVQQVEIGDTATYNANYYNASGEKTVVTTDANSTWSVTTPTIGQMVSKGKVKGLKSGNSKVKVMYNGLSAEAQLIVTAEPPPPPPPPEPDNEPPTVNISGPNTVVLGDEFCLQANGNDPDGDSLSYMWSYDGNGTLSDQKGCGLSYNTEGVKEVSVVVSDGKDEGFDDHYINVIPPQPTAAFTITGTQKENRKMQLNPIHPYGGSLIVLAKFPMTDEKWTITAMDSANQNAIKSVQTLTGNLSHTQVVDLLMKKAGTYKVKRYVKNTLGLEDTSEIDVVVQPDLAPVANFSTVTVLYRDDVKENDTDTSKAVIKATDMSYSRDDNISKRIWTITFDQNNNGSYTDDTPVTVSNVNETEIQYETDKVGKYQLELEVFEEFGQPTIAQFVDVTYSKSITDRRFHDTAKANPDNSNIVKPTSERIIQVDNLAPTVSFDVQQKKEVEIEVQKGTLNMTENELETAINSKLKKKLLENNIGVKIVYKDAILNRVHDDYGFELKKTGITVGKPNYADFTFSPNTATQLSNGSYAIAGQQVYGGNFQMTPGVTVLDSEFNLVTTPKEIRDYNSTINFGYTGVPIQETSDGKFMLVPTQWYGNQTVDMWDFKLNSTQNLNIFGDSSTSQPNITQIEPLGNDKFIFVSNRYLGIAQYTNGNFTLLSKTTFPYHIGSDGSYYYDTGKVVVVGNTLIAEKYYTSRYGDDYKWVKYNMKINADNSIGLTEDKNNKSSYNTGTPVISKSKKYMAVFYSYSDDYVKIYRLSDMQLVKTIFESTSGYNISHIIPIRDNEFLIGSTYYNSNNYSYQYRYEVVNGETGTSVARLLNTTDYNKYFNTPTLLNIKDDLLLTRSNIGAGPSLNERFATLQFGYYNQIVMEQKQDNHFTLLFDDSTITNDAGRLLKNKLDEIDSHLLAYSKSTNKSLIEEVISSNLQKGSYYDSSENVDAAVEEMAEYIIGEISGRKTIDLQVSMGETSYTQAQVETKLNEVMKSKLKAEKISYNLSFNNARFQGSNNSSSWEHVERVQMLSGANNYLPINHSLYEYRGINFDIYSQSHFYKNDGTYTVVSQGYGQPPITFNIGSEYSGRIYTGYACNGCSFDFQRKLKNNPPEFDIKESNNDIFSIVVENSPLSNDGLSIFNRELLENNGNLIALGSTSNESQFKDVIANLNQGSYINNSNLDAAVNQMADYIIDQMQAEKVDLTFSVGDTVSGDVNQIQSKINEIIAPKLNAKGISINSLQVSNMTVGTSDSGDTWSPLKSTNNIDTTNYQGVRSSSPKYSFDVFTITAKKKIKLVEPVAMVRSYNTPYAGIPTSNIAKGTILEPGQSVTVKANFDSANNPSNQGDVSRYTSTVMENEDLIVSPIAGDVAGMLQYEVAIPAETNFSIPESRRLSFVTIIEDYSLRADAKTLISKEALLSSVHLIGLGQATNQKDFNEIIQKNMDKGTFITNTDIEDTLSNLADYIIQEVENKARSKEIYLTLDEQINYFTTYNDFEKDSKIADRWKYDHQPMVFENDTGIDSRQMRELGDPIETFNKVGRYQPYYSAQDDPLTGLFPIDRMTAFESYRKWAKDADNWFIYVHRKPIPEFSFTVNGSTGAYSITNKAFDLDKESIEVGFGPGLKSQAFQWREQGQTKWQDGVPTSPLARKVYEVKNTVVDFQKREESLVKLIDATGVNKPPVAIFEPTPSLIETEEDTELLNTSYDPNGDNMTADWYFKFDSDPDSAYYKFRTGKYTNQIPDLEWSTITSFLNEGIYDIKLVVTDSFGLSDSTEREVTVLTSNTAPIACMNIPTPNYIGDTIVIDNCASDADNDLLSYTYTVKKQNGTEIISSGDSRINTEGDLTIVADQHPTDLGTWTITQEVTDSSEVAEVTGSLVVLDQTVEGQVNHTAKWLENLQKFNAANPTKAFNLNPNTGLLDFVPGEKFMLKATETEEATSISVQIKEHKIAYGSPLLSEDITNLNTWGGSVWNKDMIERFKNGDVLTFVFTSTFKNGWVDTDEVQIRIKDDPYWRQHTTY